MKTINWEKEVSEYKRSGMSQAQFAKMRGISSSALSQHRRRLEDGNSNFVEVGGSEKLEVEIAGLLKLRITEKQLVSLVQALR